MKLSSQFCCCHGRVARLLPGSQLTRHHPSRHHHSRFSIKNQQIKILCAWCAGPVQSQRQRARRGRNLLSLNWCSHRGKASGRAGGTRTRMTQAWGPFKNGSVSCLEPEGLIHDSSWLRPDGLLKISQACGPFKNGEAPHIIYPNPTPTPTLPYPTHPNQPYPTLPINGGLLDTLQDSSRLKVENRDKSTERCGT